MKFTLAWLKEHLDTSAPAEEIRDRLTMTGLEVELVEDKGKAFAPFRIARVISAEKHPNADRLRVCIVDPGDGSRIQVVCGAPNARTGMIGVFAPAGTHIPGTGIDLEKGVIRGVEFERHAPLGARTRHLRESRRHRRPAGGCAGRAAYATYAGLDDIVFDVAVTPNRPDALGVTGIARDLAAAGLGRADRAPGRGGARGPAPARSVSGSTSAIPNRSVLPSASGSSAGSGTVRRPTGCRSVSAPSASARSMRSSTSPIS